MRRLTLSIAAAALATAGAAIAAPGDGARAPQGDMTRAQAEAMAGERFAKMDANGDGTIDKADREIRRETMRARMFERLDTNKDGSVSKAEFETMHAKRAEGTKARVGQRGDRGKMAGHRMGGRKMGGRGAMGGTVDTNSDGSVSRAEFTAAAIKRFDATDTDNNGVVTLAERQAARAAMKAKWDARKAARSAN